MSALNESKKIELIREETYALESVLKNDDTEEGVHIAKPLLLKIGSAFLEQNQEGNESESVTLAITEKEAWLARDRIPITLQIGQQPVGLNLKKKIYHILLEFDTDAQAGDVVARLAAWEGSENHASKNSPRHHRKARYHPAADKKAGAR